MQTARAAHRRTSAVPVERAVTAEMPVLRIPASAGSFTGFRDWTRSFTFPEQGRIALFGEEIYIDMSPERLDSHNKVKTEVTRVLANLVVDEDLGNFYSDRTRLVNEAACLSNEPDGVFGSWRSFEAGHLRQVPSTTEEGDYIELEGVPDWVLEIVSPASEKKDTKELRERYHQAGIGEYWIIDARGEHIVFHVYWHRRSGYVAVSQQGGWQKSRAFGRSFRLERRRDRLGQCQYRLRTKMG